MPTIDSSYLDSKITFDLFPAAIIGTTFKSATVNAILDYGIASMLKDVDALHAQVYATLPNGTIRDPKQLKYIKFTLANGKTEIIADAWIVPTSIVVENVKDFRITLSAVNPTDRERVKVLLSANGFTIASTELL